MNIQFGTGVLYGIPNAGKPQPTQRPINSASCRR